MPSPSERVTGKADYGTTNIRKTNYFHWQPYPAPDDALVIVEKPATQIKFPLGSTPGDQLRLL